MSKSRTLGYFPTVDGHPGAFDGWQVSYGGPIKLVKRRATVRRQIVRSIKNRTERKWSVGKYEIHRVVAQ